MNVNALKGFEFDWHLNEYETVFQIEIFAFLEKN
jgi:hypothetical protein